MQGEREISHWMAVGALVITLILWQACTGEKEPAKEKVAVVNGTVITKADLDRAVGLVKQQFSMMGKSLKGAQLLQVKGDMVNNLIRGELLYQESEKQGIRVDNASIDKGFEKWKKQFPNDEGYKKALKKWNTSEDKIKLQFKRNASIKKLIDTKFANRITIPEKEIMAFYDVNPDFSRQPEMVRISHILIKVKPEADDFEKAEAHRKLKEVQEKLKKGADFASVARKYSQCPSGSKGGDLNYFRRGQMEKPLEDLAFSLQPGEVSNIVETRFGYHLIKVVDKKPESTIPFKVAKERIGEYLKKQKIQREIAQYVEELKKKATVEIF